jgi:hypothetical protein
MPSAQAATAVPAPVPSGEKPSSTRIVRTEREAPAPPPAIVRTETPVLLVTEVTFHDLPERRSATIQVGDAKPRLVHEGDAVEGFTIREIQPGAVMIEIAGSPVVLDVGQTMSLSVTAPDEH